MEKIVKCSCCGKDIIDFEFFQNINNDTFLCESCGNNNLVVLKDQVIYDAEYVLNIQEEPYLKLCSMLYDYNLSDQDEEFIVAQAEKLDLYKVVKASKTLMKEYVSHLKNLVLIQEEGSSKWDW